MLYQQIQDDLRAAMKAKDELRVSTLRMLWAALKDKGIELQKKESLSDEEVAAVIQKQVKERHDSIEAYRTGNRSELVQQGEAELLILSKYLPQQLSAGELGNIVDEVIAKVGAQGEGDFGKVMGVVMGEVKGKADGNEVARVVRERLKA